MIVSDQVLTGMAVLPITHRTAVQIGINVVQGKLRLVLEIDPSKWTVDALASSGI